MKNEVPLTSKTKRPVSITQKFLRDKIAIMSVLREFLESSTIHGLSYISKSESKISKLCWFVSVFSGFCIAGYLINNAYVGWEESPVATGISTHPISKLTFPEITVCPPHGSNTILNYDLIKANKLSKENQRTLETLAKDLFLRGPHVTYGKTAVQLMGRENLMNCYQGIQRLDFPDRGSYTVDTTAVRGNLSTVMMGGKHNDSEDIGVSTYTYLLNIARTIEDIKAARISVIFLLSYTLFLSTVYTKRGPTLTRVE